MDSWTSRLLRPSFLLCVSLVLIFLILPDTCYAGNKRIPPIKHLFGVGIGYQRVVHYKPVLMFQKHRRVKQRPSGWGWNSGNQGWGSGGGWKSYTPVVVQQYVHGKGHHGHSHHHGGGHEHHPKKRKPHYHSSGGSGHGSSSRGWGWAWRRRRRPQKGHSHAIGHSHHDDEPHYHSSHYEESPSHPPKQQNPTHAPDDEGYEHSKTWDGRGPEPSGGGRGYATGYRYHGDHDDHSGYESEIREHWKNQGKEPSTKPTIITFNKPQKSDTGVTKIHKEFLKSHLRHYHDFTTIEPTPFSPMLKPPRPSYGTMDLQSSEADTDHVYYDDASSERGSSHSTDEDVANEINRQMTTERTTAASTSFIRTIKPKHATKLKIKPSPPAPLLAGAGVGNKFNDPSFFPTFEQFRTIKL